MPAAVTICRVPRTDKDFVADSRFPHSAVLAIAGTAIVCILPKIQVSKTVLSRSERDCLR